MSEGQQRSSGLEASYNESSKTGDHFAVKLRPTLFDSQNKNLSQSMNAEPQRFR